MCGGYFRARYWSGVSQENVELIRHTLAAFERGDIDEALEAVSGEIVTYRAEPEGAFFHGKEGVLGAVAEWTEGFDRFSYTADDFVDAGDRVMARVRQSALLRGSDVPVTGEYWFVYAFADGKIARFEIYTNSRDARAAAGLAE
jgi:ketosteroid isomerase-like protein